jgi:hypothetical protein
VPAEFAISLVNMSVYDLKNDGHIRGMIPRYSSANVASARNALVTEFLARDAEWLLQVDADMEFPGNLVSALLEHASLERAPIVGAMCFGIDKGRVFPTLYGLREDAAGEVQMIRFGRYPRKTMWQVAGTGAACLLVHRQVFLDIAESAETPMTWFEETIGPGGKPMSEDLTFCLRAGAVGHPVHVNTALEIGHVKRRVIVADDFWAQVADDEAQQQSTQDAVEAMADRWPAPSP